MDAADQLATLVEEVTQKLEAGQRVDLSDYAEQPPEQVNQLRKLLPTLEALVLAGRAESANGGHAARDAGGPPCGRQLGDFRLVRELGSGGMGTVYEAEQLSMGRRVALKVLPFAALVQEKSLQRFRNEVRAAAALNHPNIVPVYSIGEERGVHFYAMQLIRGQTLAELIEQLRGLKRQQEPVHSPVPLADTIARRESVPDALLASNADTQPLACLSTLSGLEGGDDYRTAARLGIQAAEALQHAHDQGVLHRDIKPSNLMLDAAGKLYVTDFGLARIQADAGMTMTGDLVGTLRYMAPEQALAKRVVIDHRADVYSLGATLYELVSLEPAFTESERTELLKQIAFEEPRPLRRLDRRIPVDLETIVAKAMAKHPDERYQTAQRLADDLSAFLAHRPIKARPPTWRDQVLKWSRRHQVAMWSAVAVLLVTVAMLTASIAMISVARTKERLALDQVGTERDAGYQSLYVAEMRLAQQDWQRGDVARMQDLLDAHRPQPGRPDLRGWEWYYLQSLPAGEELVFRGHADDCRQFGVRWMAWSPDGQCAASTAFNTRLGLSEIKIWNPETGAEIRTITSKREVNTLAWSPDSQRLAACCGKYLKWSLVVWNAASGQVELDVPTGGAEGDMISWDGEGKRLISAGPDHTVAIWDAATGAELRRLKGYGADVAWTAWSPDGRWIAASGYEPGTMLIWNAETGEVRHRLSNGERHTLSGLAWSSDSSRVVTGSEVGTATVWDAATGEKLLSQHHPSTVRDVAFSPDGRWLATAIAGNRVTIFNAASGAIERTIQGHDAELNAVAWSPDGTRLATAARDGLVKIWNAAHDATILPQATDVAGPIVWSADDRFLAYGSAKKSVVLCDATTGQHWRTLAGHERLNLQGLCWNSDGSLLACPGDDGSIRVWDAATGKTLHTWTHDGLSPDYKMVALSWHPNGRQLASLVDTHAEVRIWDARSGQLVDSFSFGNRSQGWDMGIAWSPDGRRLATVGRREGLKIWDASGWQCLHQIVINQQLPSWSVAWSPDSHRLATGGTSDVPLRVFDMETGQAISAVYGQLGMGQGTVAWGDDGRRLLTCGPDGTRVWDDRSGEQLLALEGHASAAWSHDQQRIAVVTDGRVAIHNASAGYKLADDSNHLRYRARVHSLRGIEMLSSGNNQEAHAELNLALRLAADDPMVQARAAWFFATCADEPYRDPVRAGELETKAVAGMPAAGFDWTTLGMIFGDLNADPRSLEKIRLGLRFAPDEPGVLQRAVWFLTNCADEQLRDPQRAAELATKATQARPSDSGAWQVFGWALYRTGQWQASSDALEKSVQLQGDGGDPWQWYFLAMAHARQGNRDAARQWFDKSESWNKADLDPQQKRELARFAAEAKAVLAASRSVAATE